MLAFLNQFLPSSETSLLWAIASVGFWALSIQAALWFLIGLVIAWVLA